MSAEPLRLPFDVVILPFARKARSARARHASYLGSQRASAAASAQAETIVRSLATHGPQSDWQLHTRTGMLRPSVNRARGWLEEHLYVTDVGFTKGPTGAKNTLWDLTPRGRDLAAEI
jgi:hypothetical protein